MANFFRFSGRRQSKPVRRYHPASRDRRLQSFAPSLELQRDLHVEQLEYRRLLSGDFGFATMLDGGGYSDGKNVVADPFGQVYALTDQSIASYASSGFLSWSDPLPSQVEGMKLAVSSASNVYMTGDVINTTNANNGRDIYISKLAPNGYPLWTRTIGGTSDDVGVGITVDTNGDEYTTGYFGSTVDFDPGVGVFNLTAANNRSLFILKLDSDGNFVWAKSIDGMGSPSSVGIALDASGSLYTTGNFSGTMDFDPGPGVFDLTTPSTTTSAAYVLKLDNTGDFVWAKQFAGNTATSIYASSIAVDRDGNILTSGTYRGIVDFDADAATSQLSISASQGTAVYVSKLNNAGDFVWVRSVGNPAIAGASATGAGLAVDKSGGVYSTGSFIGPADFDPGQGQFSLNSNFLDIFVSKLDQNGNFAWAKNMGGSGPDYGAAVAVDNLGDVYATGTFYGTVDFDPGPATHALTPPWAEYSSFLVELTQPSIFGQVWNDADDNGQRDASEPGVRGTVALLYSSSDSIAGNSDDVLVASQVTDAQGRYYFIGVNSATGFYVEFRPPSGFEFTRSGIGYGGSDSDADPSTGRTSVFTFVAGHFGLTDAGLVGTAPRFGFAFGLGNANHSAEGLTTSTDAVGNVYVAGRFQGSVDFDPGPDALILTSAGGYDAFVAKYTAAGALLWVRDLGASNDDEADALAVDGQGNVYAAGSFNGAVNFDPTASNFTLTSNGGANAFVSKFDANGNFVWADDLGADAKARGIAVAKDGSIWTTGTYSGAGDFDPGAGTTNLSGTAGVEGGFISQLDPNGNFLIAQALVGSGDVTPAAIASSGDGSVYLGGSFTGAADFDPGAGVSSLNSDGSTDGFVLKINSTGRLLWVMGLGNVNADNVAGLTAAADGSVYATGAFDGTVDFDPGGGEFDLTSSGGANAFVWKLDSSGNFAWADGMSAGGQAQGKAIALAADGSVYTTGEFHGTADFDPGSASYQLTSAGQNDVYISKLDSNGDFAGAATAGGAADDLGAGIAVDASGSAIATGSFQGAANFSPGPVGFALTSSGSKDAFLLNWNQLSKMPSFSISGDLVVNEDAGAQFIAAWASNINPSPSGSGHSVTFALTTNDSLFSALPTINPLTGDLTYTPAANVSGAATVTVKLQLDGSDTWATQTFTITINSVNDAPSFAAANPPAANEDAGAIVLSNWAAFNPGPGVNEASQTASYTVSNISTPALFAVPPAVAPDGTLTYTLADNVSGSSTFDVQVQDNGGTANGGGDTSTVQTFTIAVNFVNDAPSFTKGPDQSLDEDARPQSVPAWATSIGPGAGANEASQQLNFIVTNNNPSLFAVQPSIDASGALTYEIADEKTGTATVTVRLHDNGGTANGGVDASAAQTFVITATGTAPAANPDSFTLSDAASSSGSGATSVLANDQSDDNDPPGMTVVLVAPPAHGTLALRTDGSFTYTPGPDFHGLDRFTYQAVDEALLSAPTTVTVLSYPASIVDKLYHQALGRAPDDAGLESWTTRIEQGATYGEIAQGIFESNERLNPIIENYYRQFLLRTADAAGVTYWRDHVWKFYGGPEHVVAGMISSPEFYIQAGGTVESWLAEVYRRLLGREADDDGLHYWADWIHRGRMTLPQVVLNGFESSPEYYGNLVDGFFEQYLGRDPSDAETDDDVAQLHAGASQRDIQLELIDSLEYRNTPPKPADGTVGRSLYID